MGFWKTFGRALAQLGNQSDRIMAVVSASIASSLAGIGVVVFPVIFLSLIFGGPIGLFFGVIGVLASSLVAKTMVLAAPTTLFILPTTALLVPARYGLRRLALLVIGSLGGWGTTRIAFDGISQGEPLIFAGALAGFTAGAVFGQLMADAD